MSHPLIAQLRFSRSEFKRAVEGISDADARRRIQLMNCVSWNIGHLAHTEQLLWLTMLQGQTPFPRLDEEYGYGQPASTPPLAEVWEVWQTITRMSDAFLDTLTTQHLTQPLQDGGIIGNNEDMRVGSLLLRCIYHYWYHIGEIMAIRQVLGHTELPEFVGDLDAQAPYSPH